MLLSINESHSRFTSPTIMSCFILDELRHMIGTETTRAGVMRVFTMCQHKRLNKRLIYVILEGVIQTLFPQSQFDKRFRQIHQRSQRGRADSSLSQSDL